jgi:hypothetical protein
MLPPHALRCARYRRPSPSLKSRSTLPVASNSFTTALSPPLLLRVTVVSAHTSLELASASLWVSSSFTNTSCPPSAACNSGVHPSPSVGSSLSPFPASKTFTMASSPRLAASDSGVSSSRPSLMGSYPQATFLPLLYCGGRWLISTALMRHLLPRVNRIRPLIAMYIYHPPSSCFVIRPASSCR